MRKSHRRFSFARSIQICNIKREIWIAPLSTYVYEVLPQCHRMDILSRSCREEASVRPSPNFTASGLSPPNIFPIQNRMVKRKGAICTHYFSSSSDGQVKSYTCLSVHSSYLLHVHRHKGHDSSLLFQTCARIANSYLSVPCNG